MKHFIICFHWKSLESKWLYILLQNYKISKIIKVINFVSLLILLEIKYIMKILKENRDLHYVSVTAFIK